MGNQRRVNGDQAPAGVRWLLVTQPSAGDREQTIVTGLATVFRIGRRIGSLEPKKQPFRADLLARCCGAMLIVQTVHRSAEAERLQSAQSWFGWPNSGDRVEQERWARLARRWFSSIGYCNLAGHDENTAKRDCLAGFIACDAKRLAVVPGWFAAADQFAKRCRSTAWNTVAFTGFQGTTEQRPLQSGAAWWWPTGAIASLSWRRELVSRLGQRCKLPRLL